MDVGLLKWLEGSFGFYLAVTVVLVAYRRIIADAVFQPKSELASQNLLPVMERLVVIMSDVLKSNIELKEQFVHNNTLFKGVTHEVVELKESNKAGNEILRTAATSLRSIENELIRNPRTHT